MYQLPLPLRVGKLGFRDIEAKEAIKQKLQSLPFEKRLKYYNENIKCLACHSTVGQIDYEVIGSERLRIYCGCNNCKGLDDFKPEHEKVYLRLREMEVKRIVAGVAKSISYKQKLQFLLSEKGVSIDKTLRVYPNYSNPENDGWIKLKCMSPVIDLTPTTDAEKTIFNEFVQAAFDKKYKIGNQFSPAYNGFNFEFEKERLANALQGVPEKQPFIEARIQEIKTTINWPTIKAKPRKNQSILDDIQKQIDQINGFDYRISSDLFEAILTNELDLNKYKLDEKILITYTHHLEIVRFYRLLVSILETKNYKLKPILLSDLQQDNETFNRLKMELLKKLETAGSFISNDEFIIAETERIEREYSKQLIKVAANGNASKSESFNYLQYVSIAYSNLNKGLDCPIENIVNNAKNNYKQVYAKYPEIIEHAFGSGEFEKAIIDNLSEGVGWLLYRKHLKDFAASTESIVTDKSGKKAGQRIPESIPTLEGLFIETHHFKKAITALKKVKAIDANCSNIIGSKLKGVMQVWIGILKNDRVMLKSTTDKNLTILLNRQFQNLNLSENTDGKHFRNTINKTASNLYRARLLALI